MYYVYILKSNKTGEIYTGQTSDLKRRLEWHNNGLQKSTKHAIPWQVIYSEKYGNRSEAIKREKFLKSGKGREIIKKEILSNPLKAE